MTGDEAAVAAVLGHFLSGVTFARGERPDYSVLPPLFVDGARLVRTSSGRPESSTVDEFVRARIEQFESGQLEEFQELETAARTELFGNVAHRFSRYSKLAVLAGTTTETDGMISTQLVRTPDGWRISAMAWDDERPGLAVPTHFS